MWLSVGRGKALWRQPNGYPNAGGRGPFGEYGGSGHPMGTEKILRRRLSGLNQFPSGELMDEPIQRFVEKLPERIPIPPLPGHNQSLDEERRKKVEADVLNIKVMQAQQEQAEASGTPDHLGRSSTAWWTSQCSLGMYPGIK